MSAVWASWAEDWTLAEKVDFNGESKRIYVHPEVSTIDFRTEIYSAYIRWIALRDNSKFMPAMRYIGGDPIGGGQYSGVMFFLQNGWQFVIDHQVSIDGILYHDDGISPYIIEGGGGITNKVAATAYAYSTTGSSEPPSSTQNAAAVWSYLNRQLTVDFPTAPTASDIAAAVRTNLTPELTHLMGLENQTSGLSPSQATMILEMYELLGLDPTKPLVVTANQRVAGDINQSIVSTTNETIVTRV